MAPLSGERSWSFFSAVDWCTLIGPDPGVDRYPPQWLGYLPEPFRGRYAPPGWTGNGVQPWGLQPDPCGADGNLFYRGWLNLLLGIRRYVSGEAGEHQPLDITGYQNRQFTWTHARIAEFISAQFRTRPQGPHCENTKIWPFCVSAAGLGLKLYDALLGTTLHEPFPRWVDYARQHYMSLTRTGELDTFAMYYDPIEQRLHSLPGPFVAHGVFPCLLYLYPQDSQHGGTQARASQRKPSAPAARRVRSQRRPCQARSCRWLLHRPPCNRAGKGRRNRCRVRASLPNNLPMARKFSRPVDHR